MAAVVAVVAVVAAIYLWTPLGRRGAGVDGPVIHSGFAFAAGGQDALIEGKLSGLHGQVVRLGGLRRLPGWI